MSPTTPPATPRIATRLSQFQRVHEMLVRALADDDLGLAIRLSAQAVERYGLVVQALVDESVVRISRRRS